MDARSNLRAAAGAGRLSLSLLLLLIVVGCSNGPTSTVEELGSDANFWGFGRRFPDDPTSNEFTFGPGDAVKILVADLPEVSGEFSIRADGKITVPLLNEVLVAGLSTDQVRRKLVARLALYLRNPEQVTVAPGVIVSKKFFIAAPNPETGGLTFQSMAHTGDLVLLDVFASMGSPSSLLDDDQHVKVIRGDPRHPRVLTINIREAVTLGYTGGNIPIQPDDIVYVPSTFLGELRSVLTGVTAPFEGLFRISQTALQLDSTARILQGQSVGLRRNTAF